MTEAFKPTPFSKVRNRPRAHYDHATVFDILDHGLVAHVGLILNDRPMVIPMAYARDGETIYIHGAKATRLMKSPEAKTPVCLTVTHIDGLVVARSAFHHSVNYRSVMVHGHVRPIIDPAEKTHALTLVTNHLLPNRWDEVRPMNDKELKATGVLAVEIETAAAKIRTGPPVDDPEDMNLDIWSGILPVTESFGAAISDKYSANLSQPNSLDAAKRKFTRG